MSTSVNERPTPDPYTNEWYQEQFRKLQHHWNRSMTEEAELHHQVTMLRKEVRELSEQRAKDMAKIGELQERLDTAAKVVTELKKAAKF